MKKLLLFFILFTLVFPGCVNAARITGSSASGKDMVIQGDEFNIDLTITFEGLGINELKSFTGLMFPVYNNSDLLIVEDVSATNFKTSYGVVEGTHMVLATLDEEKVTVDENCVNNAFCNTFKMTFKVFAKGNGLADFRIGKIAAYVVDLRNGENLTEDDIEELTFTTGLDDLNIKISKSSYAINAPTEKVDTINTNTIKKPTPVTTKKQEVTTVQPEEEKEVKEETIDNKKDDPKHEEIRIDQILRKKINKKIITYVLIGVGIIILLIIVNTIINKIRNRKLDKMLKDL